MRGVDDDIYDYVSHPTELAELGVLSHSELSIPFGFGGQEAVATAVGYTELEFAIFTLDYLLIILFLVHWSRYRLRHGCHGGGVIAPVTV